MRAVRRCVYRPIEYRRDRVTVRCKLELMRYAEFYTDTSPTTLRKKCEAHTQDDDDDDDAAALLCG